MKLVPSIVEVWLAVAALVSCVGCGGDPSVKPASDDADAEPDASDLFAWPTVPTFQLALPPERWEYMKAHAVDEEYEPAELVFEGRSVGQVGLRFKGSYGTLTNCFDAEGNLTCPKLSMKVKLDKYDPELRFFGLKRLNLHSMTRDPSLLHDKLAYDLYRKMNVVAPRSSWAVAQVNGASLGLFAMVEEIDGRFTKDRWQPQGDGDLYKEAWPMSTDPEYYTKALETNEGVADPQPFVDFATQLNAAADSAARREVLSRWTDIDYLSRYMAVDDAISNIDGATARYCATDDPQSCGNHNYFFYLTEDHAAFWLVPWDMDATLWPKSSFDQIPPWHVMPPACDARYRIDDRTILAAPGCDPLFSGLAHDLTDYDAALEELLTGPFSVEAARAAIDSYAAFIADAVASDSLGPGLETWRTAVEALKHNLPLLHARVRARRSGITATDVALSLGNVNDFEALTDNHLGLLQALSNASTTTAVGISSEQPLEGRQSLRLSFDYRNDDAKPWGQWVYLPLPIVDHPVDISSLTGVRMVVRTDSARTLRIDLDSLRYKAADEGIKLGWDVAATNAATPIELRFADAQIPPWAQSAGDVAAEIFAAVDGLAFHPYCAGRDDAGMLPAGTSDTGYLEIDAIELF